MSTENTDEEFNCEIDSEFLELQRTETDEYWTQFYKQMGLRNQEPSNFGFTQNAEVWNGRLAMFGFIFIIIREIRGGESMPMMLAQCIDDIGSFGGLTS